jgi:hypothetical protein
VCRALDVSTFSPTVVSEIGVFYLCVPRTQASDFEPGASRSCPLHPQRVKLRAAMDCCRASSDRPTTVTTASLGRDSSQEIVTRL